MQGRLQAVVLGAALATVAGCASNVSTDYNPNAGFANLRT
jgi:branched-subunit amino acid ABC-type transport system permease component